jgi:hypothetical protein
MILVVAASFLILGSALASFQVASRQLSPLERPMGARARPALVSLLLYVLLLAAAIVLMWGRYGPVGGVGTAIAGIWVFPPWFRSLWLKRLRSQSRASGFGHDHAPRAELIRALARKRLLEHGAPPAALRELQDLPDDLLDGLPEGTILVCAESFVALTSQGLTEEQAFEAIEQLRSQFKPGRGLPQHLTLATYIRYRLNLEGVPGPPIADEYIAEASEYALRAARLAFRR